MAGGIKISEDEKKYAELLLAALKTNERWAGRKTKLVEEIKYTLGEDGLKQYKQAFDPSYDKKFLEINIIGHQLTLLGGVLKNCTADNIERATEDYLKKKYFNQTVNLWKGQLKRYTNTLFRVLLAFVAVLQERVKKDKDYFEELKSLTQFFK